MMFVAIVCLCYVSVILPSASVRGQDIASSTSSALRGGNKRDFIAPLDGITDVGGVLADTYTLVSREIVKFITDLVADPITVKLANTVARNVVNGVDRLLQLSFVEDFLDSNEINFFAANREEIDQVLILTAYIGLKQTKPSIDFRSKTMMPTRRQLRLLGNYTAIRQKR